MEWQPISTAPRDGKPILIWGPRIKGDECYGPALNYVAAVFEVGEYVDGWRLAFYEAGMVGLVIEDEATHWMPLPAPPK